MVEGDDARLRDRLKEFYLDWTVIFELVHLLTKLVWGVAALTLSISAGATTASFLVVPFYYDAPGAVVGVVPDRSIRFAGSLTVPWGDVAVGARTVVELTGWSIDTLPEALLFAGIGVLFGIVAMNVLVGVSRLAGWWARLLLDPSGAASALGDLFGGAEDGPSAGAGDAGGRPPEDGAGDGGGQAPEDGAGDGGERVPADGDDDAGARGPGTGTDESGGSGTRTGSPD
jgi:hypothetical protein